VKTKTVKYSITTENRVEPDILRHEEECEFLRNRIDLLNDRIEQLEHRLEMMHQLDKKGAEMLQSAWKNSDQLRQVVRSLLCGPPGNLTLVGGDHAVEWFEELMATARKAVPYHEDTAA
jgi:hypothetical protein